MVSYDIPSVVVFVEEYPHLLREHKYSTRHRHELQKRYDEELTLQAKIDRRVGCCQSEGLFDRLFEGQTRASIQVQTPVRLTDVCAVQMDQKCGDEYTEEGER